MRKPLPPEAGRRHRRLRSKPAVAPRRHHAEQDAGLHFLLRLDGAPPDDVLRRAAEERGIRLAMLSDYYQSPGAKRPSTFWW